VILILVVLLGLAIWGYWQERKENKRISEERLQETREDMQLMSSTINEAKNTIEEFKTSNDALRLSFDSLVKVLGSKS